MNEYDIFSLCIYGGQLPIRDLRTNNITKLTLRDQGLHSEDLYILSQFIKENISLSQIDLSKNMIGFTFVEERRLLDLKMKN
jgi:hypothetical protein